MQKDYEDIKRYDAEIVAISVDDLATSAEFADKYGLRFPILSDPQRQAISGYGVLHPEENIARPAVFIVDKQGQVRWSYVGDDAADRPENRLIIEELKKLG